MKQKLIEAALWGVFGVVGLAVVAVEFMGIFLGATWTVVLEHRSRAEGPCIEETLSSTTCWHPNHRLVEGEERWVCKCEAPK